MNSEKQMSEIHGYDMYLCPVEKTLELIRGRWKPVILYLIQHDINRFTLLNDNMPRISRKVLTGQLRELEKQNLIIRQTRTGNNSREVVYSLTEKGRSVRNLIDEIFFWGLNNLLDEKTRETVKSFMIS